MSDRKTDDAAPKEPEKIGHPAGHVEIDNRGRSVWRWANDAVDSTTILLKRLDNQDLSLEPTRKVPVMTGKVAQTAATRGAGSKPGPSANAAPGAKAAAGAKGKPVAPKFLKKGSGGGFDPYNSR